MSRYLHRYHWLSLATPPNSSLLSAGPQGYIPFRHRAAVCVTYWPTTELSIKRCTCINNRCIRLKISGYHLDCGRVEFGVDATPTRSRWMSNNYITRCHRRLGLVGVSCSWSSSCSSRRWEPAPIRGLGPSGQPGWAARWERSAAKVRGTWGQYVAVCSVSNSSLTHNPFATLSRIKCERYIFLNKCVRSSLLLIMFRHIYVYV